MFPYVILIGIPATIALLKRKISIKNSKKNFIVISFFFILICLMSCRGLMIGNDTSSYKLFYNEVSTVQWRYLFNTELEYGYILLEKICSYIGFEYQIFLTAVSIISITPILYFYEKRCESSFLVIALFVAIAPFSMYFSGLRQIIAMAFAYPAYYFARNKNPVLFIIMVILAMLFHRSAFIMLIMYPFCRMKITKKWLWVVVPAMLTVFIFRTQIFVALSIFIKDFFTADVSSTGAYTVLLLLLVLTVYSYLIPSEDLLDDDTIAMRNLLLLSVALQCFAPVHFLAMRMNYYFLPFIPVLISRIVTRTKEKNAKITELSVMIMTLVFTTYFFYNLSQGGGLNIYPYKPFWS